MMDAMGTALVFLIYTLFDLYLFVLTIRLMLVWVGANYFDPFTQFIIKVTDALVKPLRRVLPTTRGVEVATLVLMLALDLIKFFLVTTMMYHFPNIIGIFILAIGDIIKIILQVFFYAILIQAVLSWLQPHAPINRTLMQFTAPIMRPLHRVIPPVGGFDITPIPALIILQLLIMLIAAPIMSAGMGVAVG